MNSAYLLLAFVFYQQLIGGEASCDSYKDCESCVSNYAYWSSCRWCALTNACHSVFGFADNVCSSVQQVTSGSSRRCGDVRETVSEPYDSLIADEMSKWSSLAYTLLSERNVIETKRAISSYIDQTYELVSYISSNCGMPMSSNDCAVVILISKVDRRIVVAFRGTETNLQLFEEFLGGVVGQLEFEPTGGKILSYFKEAHSSLYSCVKHTVQRLLTAKPAYHVYVTGHSLGGAEAQLTAASLIADDIITADKLVVYTFGSPRVGDNDFAFGYDRMVSNSWRVVNMKDPIPKIVPTHLVLRSYAYHTKREIYYNSIHITTSSNYTVCRGNEDETCSDKDNICLTSFCVYCHMRYFRSAIHNFMPLRIVTEATWTGSNSTIGECTIYSYQ